MVDVDAEVHTAVASSQISALTSVVVGRFRSHRPPGRPRISLLQYVSSFALPARPVLLECLGHFLASATRA